MLHVLESFIAFAERESREIIYDAFRGVADRDMRKSLFLGVERVSCSC